jgi:transcription antitermination factor NusG
MRTERVEGAVAGRYFSPAIIFSEPDALGCGSYRVPRWYTVRFGQINERLMLRLLDLIGLPYHIFTYLHQVGRQRETTRSWLPGYFFVEFDRELDDWGQLNRVPGIIEILGAPTALDTGIVEDLVERLPRRLPKNCSATVIPVGAEIRINDGGPFQGHLARVIPAKAPAPGYVTVLWMMFGHLREQTLRTADVEVVG